jgi:hypothetical protein
LSDAEPAAKVRALPGQEYGSEGSGIVKPAATVLAGPHRARVRNQIAASFNRSPENLAADMTIADAIAVSSAKAQGITPEQFYEKISVAKGDARGGKAQAVTEFYNDGRSIIKALNNPDASSVIHELFHVGRKYLPDSDVKLLENAYGLKDGEWKQLETRAQELRRLKAAKTINQAQQIELSNTERRLTRAEESFARGGEQYVLNGEAPNNKLGKVFAKLQDWFTGIYGSIQDVLGTKGHPLNVTMTPEVKGVLDRMLGGSGSEPNRPIDRTISERAPSPGTANRPVSQNIQKPTVPAGADAEQSGIRATGSEPVTSVSGTGPTRKRALPESGRNYLHPEARLEPQEYSQLTNEESFAAARKEIEKDPDAAYSKALDPKGGAHENAIAMEMISKAQQDGDWSRARVVMDALSKRATEQGRAVQLLSTISRIAPDGITRYADSVLQDAAANTTNGKLAESKSKAIIDAINSGEQPENAIQRLFQKVAGATRDISQKLTDAVKKAQTPADRDQAIKDYVRKHYKVPQLDDATAQQLHTMAQAAQNLTGEDKAIAVHKMMAVISEKLPSTIGSKLASIYTAGQLLNPKTILKFFIGHNTFPIAELAKDIPGTVIDKARAAVTGGERTTVLPSIPAYMRGLVRGWGYGIKAAREGVTAAAGAPITPHAEAFKGPIGKLIRAGHAIFEGAARGVYEAGVETSLDQQMRVAKLNGKTVTAPTPEMLEKAAANGAYFAFQDTSTAAKYASRLKSVLNLGQGFGLGNLVINYPKVGGNLLSRTLEYSPLGLIRSIHEAGSMAFGEPKVDTKQFTDHLSRALVGTTGAAAAFFLAKIGILRDQGPTNFKAQGQEDEEGRRKYQVNISALKRYFLSGFDRKTAALQDGDQLATYDWLEPWAATANLGAAAARKSPGGAAEALSGSLETLGEAPVLKSIRDVTSGKESVRDTLTNMAKDLPSDFVPTVIKQARRSADNTKRDTTTTKQEDPYGVKESFNRLKNSLPFASRSLPAQVNAFGEDKTYDKPDASMPRKIANTFISPAQTTTYQPTKESKYLLDLADKVGDKEAQKFLPSTAPKSVKIKDEFGQETDRELTGREREAYQRARGPLFKQQATMAADSPGFQFLQPRQQAQQLEQGNSRIDAATNASVLGDRRPGYTKKMEAPLEKDPAVFEHNSKVEAAKQETIDGIRNNAHWRDLYTQLEDVQKKHALDEIDAAYRELKVKEDPRATPAQRQREMDLASRALGHMTGYDIQRILRDAARYKPQARR